MVFISHISVWDYFFPGAIYKCDRVEIFILPLPGPIGINGHHILPCVRSEQELSISHFFYVSDIQQFVWATVSPNVLRNPTSASVIQPGYSNTANSSPPSKSTVNLSISEKKGWIIWRNLPHFPSRSPIGSSITIKFPQRPFDAYQCENYPGRRESSVLHW